MKNKKKLIITILIVALLILTGFKFFDVELRGLDKNNRLVYLDEVLKRGGSYMATVDEGDGKVDESTDASVKNGDSTTKPDLVTSDPKKKDYFEIRVSDKRIYLNDRFYTSDVSAFVGNFSGLYDGKQQLVLVDDYARYLQFNEIVSYLKEQEITYLTEVR